MESVHKHVVDRAISDRTTARFIRLRWRRLVSQSTGGVTGILTLVVSVLALVIGVALLVRSWPILASRPLAALLFSSVWQPMQGLFGFWPFIVGSASVTALAMLIAVPFAILSAIYLAEYTRLRVYFKPVIDVLASIPSVVYGLWGILFVVPLIRNQVLPLTTQLTGGRIDFLAADNPTGYGLLAGSIVLAIMLFPIIVSVTEEVLRSVPNGMREASLALGATHWETTKLVVLRKATPGLIAAIVLGFSRAFGETLAVMMVIGNVDQVPTSIFDAVYPLPALIANNYGEMMSIPMYDAALMGAALMLLLVVLFFNLGARLVLRQIKAKG